MKSISEIISTKDDKVSAKGGEKNYVINQFLVPLNLARKKTNLSEYKIARHVDKSLTPQEFARSKKYLRPLNHARLARLLQNFSVQKLYYLLSYCKQSYNFSSSFWWKVKEMKKELQKELKNQKSPVVPDSHQAGDSQNDIPSKKPRSR